MEDILHTILNPYVSVSEKDILWEIMRLEEEDELSDSAEERELINKFMSKLQNIR